MSKIFCIIPAYNESETITEVVKNVKGFVDEVVVVDDCSTDGTAILAEKAGAVVLRHIINRGQGAALKTGTEYALAGGADIIAHFDADGQFLAEEIKDVVRPIMSGEAEIVFGSRFLSKKSPMPFFKKNFIMPLARFVNRIFLNVNTSDPQSGFRAMSVRAARKINWRQDRMAHCSEILAEAAASGLRIKEVPVMIAYRGFGQRLASGFKILKELLMGALLK
ncbi:glycosyltransferase family 2 protein [Candidatus Falkowbacteria bacterium]|nr:glycosyltransferase family 2 protein [Candidatus Falkowbacteria bacterium]